MDGKLLWFFVFVFCFVVMLFSLSIYFDLVRLSDVVYTAIILILLFVYVWITRAITRSVGTEAELKD